MKLPLLLRRIHLWLGCLFAPLLVFFAVTGAIQTLGWNQWANKKVNHADLPPAQRAVTALTWGHTAHRSPFVETTDGGQTYRPFALVPSDTRTLPYSAFVAFMAVGMIVSALLGVWMAYRFGGSRVTVTLLLAAGILAPFLLYQLRG